MQGSTGRGNEKYRPTAPGRDRHTREGGGQEGGGEVGGGGREGGREREGERCCYLVT